MAKNSWRIKLHIQRKFGREQCSSYHLRTQWCDVCNFLLLSCLSFSHCSSSMLRCPVYVVFIYYTPRNNVFVRLLFHWAILDLFCFSHTIWHLLKQKKRRKTYVCGTMYTNTCAHWINFDCHTVQFVLCCLNSEVNKKKPSWLFMFIFSKSFFLTNKCSKRFFIWKNRRNEMEQCKQTYSK